MSLTGHIGNSASPVHQWLRQRLPATQTLAKQVNTELRGGGPDVPLALPADPGVDVALLGTAVGYLLGAAVQPGSVQLSVAALGAVKADRLRRKSPDDPLSSAAAAHQAAHQLAEMDLASGTLTAAEWATATRLTVVLARFEQLYRAGPMAVWQFVGRPLRRWDGRDLDALASEMAREVDLFALRPFARAVIADHQDFAEAADLHVSPTFAQSTALGGADADVIADGVLWELKSTTVSRVIGRRDLWQVAGYLLADTDDQFRLEMVGFSALRRRSRQVWFAEEYLDLLSRADRPLGEWRQEFAELLASPQVTEWVPTRRSEAQEPTRPPQTEPPRA